MHYMRAQRPQAYAHSCTFMFKFMFISHALFISLCLAQERYSIILWFPVPRKERDAIVLSCKGDEKVVYLNDFILIHIV